MSEGTANFEDDFDSDLQILDLGVCQYEKAWALQKRLQQSLIRGVGLQTLVLCEHFPVLTHGKSAKPESLLATDHELSSMGIEQYEVERGGDYTFHGPGQLVAYPILDLRRKRRDVGWYLRTLELVIIETLQVFGINGHRICGKTGVWTHGPENDTQAGRESREKARKIASIGVRLSRWCTMHGLALNVAHLSEGFRLIHPCGLTDIEMTSMHQEKVQVDISQVKEVLTWAFCRAFEFQYVSPPVGGAVLNANGEELDFTPMATENLAVKFP